jgi:hypothetical protein
MWKLASRERIGKINSKQSCKMKQVLAMERLPSRTPFYRLAVVVGGSSAPAVVVSGSICRAMKGTFLSLSVFIKNR